MVVLSTVVATIGLLQDSVAVIIGAKVIAPLRGPNAALAFSFALADFSLARQALNALPAGVGMAFVISLGTGLAVDVDPTGARIAARTLVDLPDIILALVIGTAVLAVLVALILLARRPQCSSVSGLVIVRFDVCRRAKYVPLGTWRPRSSRPSHVIS